MPTPNEKQAKLDAYVQAKAALHQAEADLLAALDDGDFLLDASKTTLYAKVAGQIGTPNLILPTPPAQ